MNGLSPDGRLSLTLWVFLLSWLFLSTSYDTTYVFDHSIYSAILACVVVASILLFLGISGPDPNSKSYSPKSLFRTAAEDFETLAAPSLYSLIRRVDWARIVKLPGRNRFATVACLLCLRINLFHQVSVHTECSAGGYEYAIPLLISLYDYFRNQQYEPVDNTLPLAERPSNARSRVIRTSYRRLCYYVLQSRERYLVSTAFLAFGGLLASSFQDGQASTYICSLGAGQNWRIPIFRFINTFLDAALLTRVSEVYNEWTQSPETQQKLICRQWGYLLLGIAALWVPLACIVTLFGEQGGLTFRINGRYVQSVIGQGVLLAFFFWSVLQLIPRYGILVISMLAGFIALYSSSISTLFGGRQPFPLIRSSDAVSAFIAIFAGVITFLYSWSASEDETKQLPIPKIFVRLLFILLLGVGFTLALLQQDTTTVHPVDLLISKGRNLHANFTTQANASNSLGDAVAEYQRRYKYPPPPAFDKWYEYATSRKSPIIDDFDQIFMDLQPFRAFTPQRLRELTHEMVTHPANNIAAVSVRNGTAIAQEGIRPTHAWMISAAVKMIEKFSSDLPDMDIAFNLDDQPRIAARWGTVSTMRNAVRSQEPQDLALNLWSTDRASKWAPVQPVHQTRHTSFGNNDGLRVFDKFVRDLCPPSSKARTRRIWDRHGICLNCIRPHSIGQFPSDWNLANDVCHQPDVAELHGAFSGPTAFTVSREMLPVFSQSSIPGFSDILYPSPFNYIDKVKYEPSEDNPDLEYDKKDSKLFWIGSTSEGMGSKGRWKGLSRQRLCHLVNNNTEKVSVLLPTTKSHADTGAFSYQILNGSAPKDDLGLQTEIHITDPIKHCGECGTQRKELGTAPQVDFQSFWRYRYLIDLDGAGFSGRFIPFLQSHSVPFKSGLFRQWFDSRITPWLHFVPVDIRLHGLWSTLAYFAGVNGTISGGQGGIFDWFGPPRQVQMKAHDSEAVMIAEEGRKWADMVIRKVDMEIYFFRLLLEWGRLTDDLRDVLGFKLE